MAELGVEVDADDLGVESRASTDVGVGGAVEMALAISNLGASNAGDALEGELGAPEAAGAKLGQEKPRSREVLIEVLGGGGADTRRRRRRRRGGNAAVPEGEAEPSKPFHGVRRLSFLRREATRGFFYFLFLVFFFNLNKKFEKKKKKFSLATPENREITCYPAFQVLFITRFHLSEAVHTMRRRSLDFLGRDGHGAGWGRGVSRGRARNSRVGGEL